MNIFKLFSYVSSNSFVLLGMVYACGDNSEGALGMDDMFPRHSFMPVIWQQLQSSTNTHSRSTDSDGDNKLLSSQHPFIVKIAAAVGYHRIDLNCCNNVCEYM